MQDSPASALCSAHAMHVAWLCLCFVLTGCRGSGMSPDDVIGSADVSLTYDRPETEGELRPDTLVEFDGVQCNPSGNPRSSPFTPVTASAMDDTISANLGWSGDSQRRVDSVTTVSE